MSGKRCFATSSPSSVCSFSFSFFLHLFLSLIRVLCACTMYVSPVSEVRILLISPLLPLLIPVIIDIPFFACYSTLPLLLCTLTHTRLRMLTISDALNFLFFGFSHMSRILYGSLPLCYICYLRPRVRWSLSHTAEKYLFVFW